MKTNILEACFAFDFNDYVSFYPNRREIIMSSFKKEKKN